MAKKESKAPDKKVTPKTPTTPHPQGNRFLKPSKSAPLLGPNRGMKSSKKKG
jgi:hypothetical protein